MKRMYVIALLMLLTFSSVVAKAADKKSLKARVENMTEQQKEARVLQMKQRVMEIKNMDKSALTKIEKKRLRNELKDMNQEARALGSGGVYISLAGLIIIVLLLILLL
jgi:hypothetical protein